jgi:hypothetical protein
MLAYGKEVCLDNFGDHQEAISEEPWQSDESVIEKDIDTP